MLALHTCFAIQEKGSEFKGAQVTQHVNGLGFLILRGVVIVVLLFCGGIDLPLHPLLEMQGSCGQGGMACAAICLKKFEVQSKLRSSIKIPFLRSESTKPIRQINLSICLCDVVPGHSGFEGWLYIGALEVTLRHTTTRAELQLQHARTWLIFLYHQFWDSSELPSARKRIRR